MLVASLLTRRPDVSIHPRAAAWAAIVFQDPRAAPLIPEDKPMTKPIILTGDRTTGPLHIGHYAGSLRNRLRF